MVVTQTSNGNYTKVNPKPRTYSASSAPEKFIGNDRIDSREKKFFANMFPENKEEIMSYHFYEKTGKMNGIKIGSNYDRRG